MSQTTKLKAIHKALTDYGTQLDDQFANRAYMHDEAQALREWFLLYLDQAFTCEGDMCMTYSYDMIVQQFADYVKSYLEMKAANQKLNTLSDKTYAEPAKDTVYLQKHLAKIMTAGYDLTRPINEKGTTTINLTTIMPMLGTLNGKVDIVADSKYDLTKWLVDSKAALDGSVSMTSPTQEKNSIAAKGTVTIKMLDKDAMYLSLAWLNVTAAGADSSVDVDTLKQIQTALGDSYLKLPFSPDLTQLGVSTINGAGLWNSFYFDFINKSMIDFYHQENPFTYYGVLSYNACDVFASLGANSNDCFKSVDNMRLHSDGKGMIVLKEEAGRYQLMLDDKYATLDTELPTYLLRKPIVDWNKEKIHVIDAQLSDNYNDRLHYEGDMLTVKYNQNQQSTDFVASVTKDKITGAGTIDVDGTKVSIELDYQKGKIEKMTLTIGAEQDNIQVLTLKVSSEGSIDYIDGIKVTTPSNVLTLEQLQEKLNQTTN